MEVGSGEVPFLATPRLITWMEAETVRAADRLITTDQTTVGTAIRVDHLRATPLGGLVHVTAEPPTGTTGRRITFAVQAVDDSGELVAAGEIDRAIVDRQRFAATASAASGHARQT